MLFKAQIPVKPYVRKYIERKYGATIRLNTTTTVGFLLYCILEKKNSYWHRESEVIQQVRYRLLTDKITAIIPANEKTLYTAGYTLPATKAILVNDMFEKIITDEIINRCNTYAQCGLSRNKAIEDFCDEYDILINVDISHDALRKAEYRERVKRSANVKSRA